MMNWLWCAFYWFYSMVTGIPAKVIGYVDDQDPSLTMKHGMFVLADWQYILFSWKLALLRFSFIMIYIPHMHVNISRNWLLWEEGKKKVMLPSPARVSSFCLKEEQYDGSSLSGYLGLAFLEDGKWENSEPLDCKSFSWKIRFELICSEYICLSTWIIWEH